jgi:hypothetical protein
MSHRRIEYLHKHRIIYHRNPITDKPTKVYDWGYYYENGTFECYSLFRSKALINTYKSLKWHLYVLWYLNHHLDQDSFLNIAKFITDKHNGFVTFDAPKGLIDSIVYDVSMKDLEEPPPNKLRKVIFKDGCKLNTNEKLSIVGHVVGKKRLSESEIYDAMLYTVDANEKITISKIADQLGCSTRTIYRNMGIELKKEKELLNQQIKI